MKSQLFLSIQSHVSYGHVGNSAVTFPLQRLGVNVIPIHTVLFSNHTGYGQWRGSILDTNLLREILQGVLERGAINHCDVLLSGYMGSKELGYVTLEALSILKALNPNLIYCFDPVMGDLGRGFFVKDCIPEFFKQELIQHADIITPNHFELEYLSGTSFSTIEETVKAARQIMSQGPKVVLVTSLILQNTLADELQVCAIDKNHTYIVTTPKLPVTLNGTGDLTSALFAHFYLLHENNIKKALEETISRIYALIDETYKRNSKELDLVAGQELLIHPHEIFIAKEL